MTTLRPTATAEALEICERFLTPAMGCEFIPFPSGGDDRATIQAALLRLHVSGGGELWLGPGIFLVSADIVLYPDTTIRGRNRIATFIKAADDAVFADGVAVIHSPGFAQSLNLWEYYPPYPAGLCMGSAVLDLTVDGNKANVANAGGIYLYGAKWTLSRIGVINVAGHGIWTECGALDGVSSSSGDNLHDYLNMHESLGLDVLICNTGKRGWYYRGPNDSYVDKVQIKNTGWGGFITEKDATCSPAGLKAGTIHAYGCNSDTVGDPDKCQVKLLDAIADNVYLDNPQYDGIVIDGYGARVGVVKLLAHNNFNHGDYWGLVFGANASFCEVDTLIYEPDTVNLHDSDSHGGAWKVTGPNNTVKNFDVIGATGDTLDYVPGIIAATATGTKVKGAFHNIRGGGPGGGVTKLIQHLASSCDVDVVSNNCLGANYSYENTGLSGNTIALRDVGGSSGTVDIATGVLHKTDRVTVDNQEFSREIINALDFGGRSIATFATGTLTLLKATMNQYAPSAPTVVNNFATNIGAAPFIVLLNTGTANLTLTHNAGGTGNIWCKGSVDCVLPPSTGAMFTQIGGGGKYVQIG